MSAPPMTTAEALDDLERLEQSITRTLQEIDQSFADCHTIVSSKILPQIDRYAESSRLVWDHAKSWVSFFETAATPSSPSTTAARRAHARNRTMAAAAALNQAHDDYSSRAPEMEPEGEVSTTPEYDILRRDHIRDQQINNTNRRRISMTTSRLSPGFMGSSPGGSMPSTPTPLYGKRVTDRLGGSDRTTLPAPPNLRWPEPQGTPTRSQHRVSGGHAGSTTPSVTFKDRPRTDYTQNAYPQPPASTAAGQDAGNYTPRGSLNGGFIDLDVTQNHQDVITPPSTLHFSIPQSKISTTPKSVVAKSLVDKIRMKDGLVIPQPIFVHDDEDEQGTGSGRNSGDAMSIGGSKKRNHDGDLLGQTEGQHGQWKNSNGSGSSSNHRGTGASPRKMAATASNIFLSGNGANGEDEDEEDDGGRSSPSRQLMAQIESQTDPRHSDPLLAALVTPPELRRNHVDFRTRTSVSRALGYPGARASLTQSSAPPTSSSLPESVAPQPGTTTPTSQDTGLAPILTTTPIDPILSGKTGNLIDSIFKESFSTGFAASAFNRQPAAGTSTLLSRGTNNRSSVGAHGFKAMAPPFGSPRRAGTPSTTNRMSLMGGSSSLRRALYPSSPSPASRAAASAVASAAAVSGHSGSRPNQPFAIDRFSFGAGGSGGAGSRLSTPVVSLGGLLHQQEQAHLAPPDSDSSASRLHSDYGGFTTPFSNREPPPAPRLGYHSDTLMTQSSLGLNHDGFGFEEDRTRTTMASEGRGGMSSVETNSIASRQQSQQQHQSRSFSATATTTPGDGSGNTRMNVPEGDDLEDDDGDDDPRSPCPPGKTFGGAKSSLQTLAAIASSSSAGSSGSPHASSRPGGFRAGSAFGRS